MNERTLSFTDQTKAQKLKQLELVNKYRLWVLPVTYFVDSGRFERSARGLYKVVAYPENGNTRKH